MILKTEHSPQPLDIMWRNDSPIGVGIKVFFPSMWKTKLIYAIITVRVRFFFMSIKQSKALQSD